MKRWITVILICVVILGGAAYFFRDTVRSGLRAEEPTQLTMGEALTVIPVTRGDIFRYMTASGNLQPNRQVDLRFSVSGRVVEVFVQPGDRVEADTPLVRLDNRQQELAYQQAKINYELALFDAAPTVVQEREYEMQVAYDNLQRTILKAPFAGLVTDVHVEPGQSVGTSDVVVSMIDDSVYKVQVAIDELDISEIAVGQRATITLDADRTRPRTGFVERIGFVANVQSSMVTVPVTVQLDKTDPFLRPGYSATVQIAVVEARNVVRVPVEAINTSSGVPMVTKVVDGKAVPTPVQTGLTDGVWIEIRSGLEEGDQIVGLNYRVRDLFEGGRGMMQSQGRGGGSQLQDALRSLPGVSVPGIRR